MSQSIKYLVLIICHALAALFYGVFLLLFATDKQWESIKAQKKHRTLAVRTTQQSCAVPLLNPTTAEILPDPWETPIPATTRRQRPCWKSFSLHTCNTLLLPPASTPAPINELCTAKKAATTSKKSTLSNSIKNMTVAQLKLLAASHNISIPSRIRKEELIELLKGGRNSLTF